MALWASPAWAGSLPSVPSGHRPGPDVLYAPPPRAPQLENVKPWRAEPPLASPAPASRAVASLYQAFLYGDRGARGVPAPGAQGSDRKFLASSKRGEFT